MSPKQRKSHIQAADHAYFLCVKTGKLLFWKKNISFLIKDQANKRAQVEYSLEDQALYEFKLLSWFKSNLSMQINARYQMTTAEVSTNLQTDFNET